MNESIFTKEAILKGMLSNHNSVAVAFSGGVDSTLLLDITHEMLDKQALALTACMASFPERERKAARHFCEERGIRQIEVDFDEFAISGFADNPPDRCYLCKHALFSELLVQTEEQGASALIEGSNVDDEGDYRPGLLAIAELGIASPLKAAGLTKAEIRELSRERGLPTWDKPACACLATRLPFGARLSPELFRRIDTAEQCILECGARQVRVRAHGSLARIEVDEDSIPLLLKTTTRHHLDAELRKRGFDQIAVDLRGYQTGSMNSVSESTKGT